jgi:lysophospholipase L1-like esterase
MSAKVDLHRFDGEIKKLGLDLRRRPPKPGGVLLYGSSTMANWRANDWCYAQLAPFPVTNTGFGGSTAEEALYYYHSLALPVRPSVIVYYEGANDLGNNYTPEEVIDTTHRLFEWCRQDFKGVRFLIIPIKLSPGNKIDHAEGGRCNKLFEEYAGRHKDTGVIDVSSLIYDKDGCQRTDIYVEDMLHHNQKGYEELAALVKAGLEKVYHE